MIDFREGGLFNPPPPLSVSSPKNPILNRVKMKSKPFFIILKGLSMKQITQNVNFFEGEILTLDLMSVVFTTFSREILAMR